MPENISYEKKKAILRIVRKVAGPDKVSKHACRVWWRSQLTEEHRASFVECFDEGNLEEMLRAVPPEFHV